MTARQLQDFEIDKYPPPEGGKFRYREAALAADRYVFAATGGAYVMLSCATVFGAPNLRSEGIVLDGS